MSFRVPEHATQNDRARMLLDICNVVNTLESRAETKRQAFNLALQIQSELCGVLEKYWGLIYSSVTLANLFVDSSIPKLSYDPDHKSHESLSMDNSSIPLMSRNRA